MSEPLRDIGIIPALAALIGPSVMFALLALGSALIAAARLLTAMRERIEREDR